MLKTGTIISFFFILLYASKGQEIYSYETICKDHSHTGYLNTKFIADPNAVIRVDELVLPEIYQRKHLPDMVDNSGHPYLRPVFQQEGASCGQAASMGYHFTYEIDRKRMVPASLPENQYPTHFVWNFMNDGLYEGYLYGVGVSYFHSFSVLKELGCPSVADYGGMWRRGDSTRWMSGYELYHKSMKNRIEGLYGIDVSNPDGLLTLKHWLFDHLEESDEGGVANFYAGIIFPYHLPQGTPEAGKSVILSWYPEATHAMTIVGYNDSIRFDYNGDGQFTNNLDINNDGKVSMQDWEIGGLKFINSYGLDWGDSGFCYMMYKTLADVYGQGGIWNNTVHVVRIRDPYEPLLTMKVRLKHTSRGKIKVMAGVAADTSQYLPSHVMEFPVFNYQGGDIYMQGGWEEQDRTIEFGLDITPLVSYTTPGQPARFFLLVDENDPWNEGEGEIIFFSVIDYHDGITESACNAAPCELNGNDLTMVSVTKTTGISRVQIKETTIPAIIPGQPYSCQLTATGGTPPYSWDEHLDYSHHLLEGSYPMVTEEKLIPHQAHDGYAVKNLGFSFPYYGNYYDSVYVFTSGCVMFQRQDSFWPYVLDMDLFLSSVRLISPFLSEPLMIRASNGDGIWYEGSGQYAMFRWKLTDRDNPSSSSFDFTLKLFPDGIIEFHYGAFTYQKNLNWIAGFSDGNDLNTLISANGKEIRPEMLHSIRFIPSYLPSGLHLTENGLIEGIPVETSQVTDLRISVTDYHRITDTRWIELTPSLSVRPTIHSGSDGLISRNESVGIDLEIENLTSVTVDSVRFSAATDDPYVMLDVDEQFLGTVFPGQPLDIPSAVTLVPGMDAPDEHRFMIRIRFSWPVDTLEKKIFLTVAAPLLRLGDILISDGNNGRLDPGETANVMIKVNNNGHDRASDVRVVLTYNDPYLSVNQELVIEYDDIAARSFKFLPLCVTANESTPAGHIAEIAATLSDSFGVADVSRFFIQTGPTPVLIIDLDENLNSAPVINECIRQTGLNAEYTTYLPWWDLYRYQAVFLCLGVFPFNYELDFQEGEFLSDYLLEGGNLYMEGSTTWVLDDHTAVHDLFSLEGKNQAWPTGIDTLSGDEGTFTEDMQFVYSGESTRMDNLVPIAPAFSLFHEKTTGYSFAVAHEGEAYRTIGASFELGGLTDTLFPSVKSELTRQILHFFGINPAALAANFISDANYINTHETVVYTNLSSEDATSWSWSFPGGKPAASSESQPMVTYDSAGVFDVMLTVSNGKGSNTLVKRNYITVISGTGIADLGPGIRLHLYPNPSSGLLFLEISRLEGNAGVKILNQIGDVVMVMDQKIPGNGLLALDVSQLPAGVYLVMLTGSRASYAEKLVIVR